MKKTKKLAKAKVKAKKKVVKKALKKVKTKTKLAQKTKKASRASKTGTGKTKRGRPLGSKNKPKQPIETWTVAPALSKGKILLKFNSACTDFKPKKATAKALKGLQ